MFVDEGYKTFNSMYSALQTYIKKTVNTSLNIIDKEAWLVGQDSIEQDQQLFLQFGASYWLHQAGKSENSYIRIVANILLDLQLKPVISVDPKLKPVSSVAQWRSWTVTQCNEYLTKLDIDIYGELCQQLNILGYCPRVVLYRILQAVGYIQPPSGAEYARYPEGLKTLAHQSRGLCFWPVEIGKNKYLNILK